MSARGFGDFDDYYMWGDWVMFEDVNFGTSANEISAYVALDLEVPQVLEMWIDGLPGNGAKIGQVIINPTGGWDTYVEHEGVVDVCSVHDLYFIGKANNVYWAVGNLIEGNSINSSRATDWWGSGGNYITYFRNRINFAEEHGGSLGIRIGDRTHYANITGNSFPGGITGVLEPPHFWDDTPWSAVGADVDSPGAMQIPAEGWYQRILANGSAIPF